MYEDLGGMHLALSLIFIYHFYLYFITLLSHRLNSLAVCVTSWICGPQLPKRVRNSCSGIDRCVLVNCCYRRFKSPSFEKKCHLLGDGKMFPVQRLRSPRPALSFRHSFLSKYFRLPPHKDYFFVPINSPYVYSCSLCNIRSQKSAFRLPKLVPHNDQLIINWQTISQNTEHNLWRW